MLIGEVARRSGVSARMLRHYESLGLIRPTGRGGTGYREYSDENIRRVFHIESLRSLGLSLRDVGRALDDPGFAPAELVAGLVRRSRERIAAETELLTRLRRIDAAEPAGWEEVLRITALLQGLGSASPEVRQRAALSASAAAPLSDEAGVPVEALVEAVLGEPDPSVAGALRWALAQTGPEAGPLLAAGLDAADPGVRVRAVRSLAELPDPGATALLRAALGHGDAAVRGYAALALGARGVAAAVPHLVGLVAEGRHDVEAAEALGSLAADDPAEADRIATALTERLTAARTGADPAALASAAAAAADPATAAASATTGAPATASAATAAAPVRRRITQALAEVPGPVATRALAELTGDEDRAVAATAAYVLGLREERRP
ncbi:HEAT repeat domain-containing protein [Streptomyces sp. NPDC048659]|uniref:HEAT repeat domain-containing protein n=1 Tax=Streptomyces sp. NPDC048659 TaxID=3155489 RepID=UPI003443FF22